ncbi:hypothetical protein CSUI_003446 [Cystoisospora suis]|uniref:Uncharacterized protein n=1 Tax=Cystoisospora suis TaxID=483139 RepID=A0A2C6L540_9APIC|nr:hypothetical protein CSUI_003446 [Cystoisospora suis]
MGTSLSTHKGPQLLSAVAAASAVGAVWWITSRRSWEAEHTELEESTLTQEETESTLEEISEAFHAIFVELAQVSRNVIQALQDQGFPKPVPREQVEAMLMQQIFHGRLADAEKKIFARRRLSREALQRACSTYKDKSVSVGLLVDGVKAMYRHAVDGELPLLPGAQVPDGMTDEKILHILEQIHKAKQAKIQEALQERDFGGPPSISMPFAQKLQECNKKAEEEVLARQENAGLTEQTLLHAVAVFSRQPQFKLKKQLLDEMHTEAVLHMINTGGTSKTTTKAAGYWCGSSIPSEAAASVGQPQQDR